MNIDVLDAVRHSALDGVFFYRKGQYFLKIILIIKSLLIFEKC